MRKSPEEEAAGLCDVADWACVVAARSELLKSDPRGSAKVRTAGELARDYGGDFVGASFWLGMTMSAASIMKL
ncbi:hypothetical protein RYX36_028263 [Vicia faba]